VAVALVLVRSGFGQSYPISTVAGAGWDLPGLSANLANLEGLAADGAGNVFMTLSSYSVVVRLDLSGQLSLVAGNDTTASIPGSKLIAGDIFGARTNGGHYAKVLVTAVNGPSLVLQYTTFIAPGSSIAAHPGIAGPPPFIYWVQNNYSLLLPGVPNYGIAPGSLFTIQGLNLSGNSAAVLQSSAAPGLPTTLNQTSLSATVNGVTTTPVLYYTSEAAVAAVLPSTTPVGTGTITLTFNGNKTQAPIQVVASAVGLDTLLGAGGGAGVVTDSNFNLLGLTNSATPGEAVTLWGSGVGADTSNCDTTYPQEQNQYPDAGLCRRNFGKYPLSRAVKSLAITGSQYTSSAGKVTDQAFVLSANTASTEFSSGYFYASEGSCSVFPSGTGFPIHPL
jgi:uncharacterized protein (TIGR03437 family)